MHIDDDESIESELCLLTELLSDKDNRVSELLLQGAEVLLDSWNTSFANSFVNILRPMDLASVQDAHSSMTLHPLCPLSLGIVLDGLQEHASHRRGHHLFDITHPVLNIPVSWVDLLHKVDFLAFS